MALYKCTFIIIIVCVVEQYADPYPLPIPS